MLSCQIEMEWSWDEVRCSAVRCGGRERYRMVGGRCWVVQYDLDVALLSSRTSKQARSVEQPVQNCLHIERLRDNCDQDGHQISTTKMGDFWVSLLLSLLETVPPPILPWSDNEPPRTTADFRNPGNLFDASDARRLKRLRF